MKFRNPVPSKNYQPHIDFMFKVLEDENLAKIIRIEASLLDKTGEFYRFEGDNGELLYYDDDHLSLDGASIVVPPLVDDLIKTIEKQKK